MRFVFVPGRMAPIHAGTLSERPLGGTETGLIHLAKCLSNLGHEVIVLTHDNNPPKSSPLYLPLSQVGQISATDVLVAVREWRPMFAPISAKKRFFWTGDSYDQAIGFGVGDKRIVAVMDGFLAVSAWQADTVAEASGFPREKIWVIRNGINREDFEGAEPRERKRLIYSTTPFRGLDFVPELYLKLREKHADAEIHIFSGYEVYRAVYAGTETFDAQAEGKFAKFSEQLRGLPNCFVHGNVIQSSLAREYMRSSLLFYPNTYEETSCITALEAQAAGCPIVTTKRGALPETVGAAGELIEGEPGTEGYTAKFLKACDRILSDDTHFEKLSQAGKEQTKMNDWSAIARRFVVYLNEQHGLS